MPGVGINSTRANVVRLVGTVSLAILLSCSLLVGCTNSGGSGDTNSGENGGGPSTPSWTGPEIPTQDATVLEGNTSCNLNNAGWAVRVGDWIIGLWNGNLSKFRPDGSSPTKLADGLAFYINVVGNTIYYTQSNQASQGPSPILTVQTDGSGLGTFQDISAYSFQIFDGVLFYINEYGNIMQINLDGSNHQMVCGSCSSTRFAVTKDNIYYLDESQLLTRYDRATGNLENLAEKIPVSHIITTGDKILYVSSMDNSLYRAEADGSNASQLASGVSEVLANADTVFYVDDTGLLYSLPLDGSGTAQKLTDNMASTVQLVGNVIIDSNTPNMSFIATDGSGAQIVDMTK